MNQEEINGFIEEAFKNRQGPARSLSIRPVNAEEIAKIKEVSGIDVAGYTHDLTDQGLRHLIGQHGDEKKETARGQIPLTKEDLAKIPSILDDYDDILPGANRGRGEVIVYEKRLNGYMYYLELMQTGKKKNLVPQSMYRTKRQVEPSVFLRKDIARGADAQRLSENPDLTSEFNSRLNPSIDINISSEGTVGNIPENVVKGEGDIKFKRGEAEEYAPTFYSQLQRVIEQKMPNRATLEQIKGIVGKGAVKEEELKWSGLDDFLAERQGQKVAKQDVLDYLRENDIQVQKWVQGHTRYESLEEAQAYIDNNLVSATVHSLPITESMRQSVLYEGQPKFKKESSPEIDFLNQVIGGGRKRRNKLQYAPEAMKREDMQAANTIARAFTGQDIVPFRGGSNQGINFGRQIYLNEKMPDPVLYVAKHEVIHSIEVSSPELHAALINDAKSFALAADHSEIINHYTKQGYSKERVWEEFNADVLSEVMERPDFWAKVRETSPQVIRKVIDVIDQLIAKFKEAVGMDQSMLKYISDLEAYRDTVAPKIGKHLGDMQSEQAFLERLNQMQEPAAKAKGEGVIQSPFITPEYRKQIEAEKSAFSSQVDNWKRGDIGFSDALTVGETPKVLTRLGAEDLPVFITQNTLHKSA